MNGGRPFERGNGKKFEKLCLANLYIYIYKIDLGQPKTITILRISIEFGFTKFMKHAISAFSLFLYHV